MREHDSCGSSAQIKLFFSNCIQTITRIPVPVDGLMVFVTPAAHFPSGYGSSLFDEGRVCHSEDRTLRRASPPGCAQHPNPPKHANR